MDKLLEIGQAAGTPLAYLVIIVFAYKLFEIVAKFITTMIDIAQKFVDKYFTHIDNLEKELKESNRNIADTTKQLTQAINALNQVVAIQNQSTNQNTQELKPLTQAVNKVETAIRHCEQMAARER